MNKSEQRRQRKAQRRREKVARRGGGAAGASGGGAAHGGLMGMRRGFKAMAGAGRKGPRNRFWDVLTWIVVISAVALFAARQCQS